jgi:hypothetical protein
MDELIEKFNAAGVRYLLLGGQAMRLLGMPRFSMDWDFFIPPHDEANIGRLNELLGDELDSPLESLGPSGEGFVQTYQTQWGVVQFHLRVPGVPAFERAEAEAVTRPTEHGVPVKSLSGSHLLAAKEAANRPQDQPDLKFLRELQRLGKLR